MTKKKNRISIFGKTFHVTPAGKILPLGAKKNWFTDCMSEQTKGKMATGKGADNRAKWQSALQSCATPEAHYVPKTLKPKGRGRTAAVGRPRKK